MRCSSVSCSGVKIASTSLDQPRAALADRAIVSAQVADSSSGLAPLSPSMPSSNSTTPDSRTPGRSNAWAAAARIHPDVQASDHAESSRHPPLRVGSRGVGTDPSASASHPLEYPGRAHAAADAHRHHAVAALRRGISCSSVVVSFAPVQPSGWPSAMAPPLTFSRSGSIGQLAQAGEHLRGERLVELDQVDSGRASGRPASAPSGSPAPGRCRTAPARRRPWRRRRSGRAA